MDADYNVLFIIPIHMHHFLNAANTNKGSKMFSIVLKIKDIV